MKNELTEEQKEYLDMVFSHEFKWKGNMNRFEEMVTKRMKTDLQTVVNIHQELCLEARDIIATKGMDYNRTEQAKGDTLANMRTSTKLGITDSVTQGVLVRLSDKFKRLISLTKDPQATPATKDESVKDTIKDTINYLVYLYIFYVEAREEANHPQDHMDVA